MPTIDFASIANGVLTTLVTSLILFLCGLLYAAWRRNKHLQEKVTDMHGRLVDLETERVKNLEVGFKTFTDNHAKFMERFAGVESTVNSVKAGVQLISEHLLNSKK